MKIKSTYLVMLMSLFLMVVFLDQNRTPVPVKMIIGSPLQLELSLIIIVSMAVGAISTMSVVYLLRRRKAK